ncbi:MAG: ATP-binding cassette domain-containing protein, partial [Solirubrobacterales bacterium]|nr:ATP-binding cassette domain-containing protein [Solirubrobacterales bacterium]
MADRIVVAEGLTKSFDSLRVLRDIDLAVERGQVICIVGPSGSGKSTLLRCINLLERPDSGRVVVDGVELTDPDTDIDAARRTIGMLFQAFNLFSHLTVLDNVAIAQRKVLKRTKTHAYEVARATLAKVGLSDKETAMPAQLSGGQQQRAAI